MGRGAVLDTFYVADLPKPTPIDQGQHSIAATRHIAELRCVSVILVHPA